MSLRSFAITICGVLVLVSSLLAQGGLKIVVIAGEDAVNVIQQGTSVAPIVEVRDRNDQPLPAAVVTFSVRNARSATFPGGMQSVTTVTDASGRATTSVTPVGRGKFDIEVRANFRGQTATTRISQTNVPTSPQTGAAQSGGSAGVQGAAAGGAVASGAAAGGAGGAASGGVSGAVIAGIVGAGAAGGYFAARELMKKDEGLQLPRVFTMTYSAQGALVMSRAGFPSCSAPYAENGSVEVVLNAVANGVYSGTATQSETTAVTNTLCTFGSTTFPLGGGSSTSVSISGPATGPADRLQFAASRQTVDSQTDISFAGNLAGETIVGTYTKRYQRIFPAGNPPATYEWRIDLDVPVTLR